MPQAAVTAYMPQEFVFPMFQHRYAMLSGLPAHGGCKYVRSNNVTTAPDALQMILSNDNIVDDHYNGYYVESWTDTTATSAMNNEADTQ